MRDSASRDTVRTVAKLPQSDYGDWDEGRDGYLDLPQKAAYAPVPKAAHKTGGQRHRFGISREEHIGSVIATAGMIWTAYAATVDYAGLWRFQILPPGPIELCALGVLVWLHAKWRRSVNAG